MNIQHNLTNKGKEYRDFTLSQIQSLFGLTENQTKVFAYIRTNPRYTDCESTQSTITLEGKLVLQAIYGLQDKGLIY